MCPKEKLANRLRELRGNRSRNDVAQALGISCSAIALYENGERIPRDHIKVSMAEYYGVTVGDLFFDEESCVSQEKNN